MTIETDAATYNPSSYDQVNYIEVIETVITSLREEGTAMVNHNQDGYLWKFKYGSVDVLVQLSGLTDDDTLTVWSSILSAPFKNELHLLQKLMRLNWSETLESRFALLNDQVVVLSSRTVADLSPGEISRAITIVATLADDYDDALIAEFSA
ncbi:YbjN domain-containing protein [Prochlorothrix hollandica]|uniref:YbjN domain-containing protein n=1 Tax=Prochlorothrix hollandica PCC 9006 = CALU 1027 TaxID=317619 RepID=A0A0M2Q112_PROHO|nr:YbjN domain-containing protein [Prochlorothrix hollandica]KKJ00998.1 hypothetical protein PROH_00750 [Prochlorothrix hollandica PCC 9006 = CALU 1027]